MKRWFPIAALFCIVAFSACNRPVETRHGTSLPSAASPQLQAIDSVMQQWPDSALALLLDCRDGVHTVFTDPTDRHYYQLLLSEALYKNDSVQRNRKALQQAMAYFDSLVCGAPPPPLKGGAQRAGDSKKISNLTPNLAFLSARAHYMNGVGYYENDSAVPACKEYMKALDIMQDHFEEKELVDYKAKFMALTYTRLTMLFSDLYLHEQAIYFAQLSLPYYQRYAAPSWHLARMLYEVGINYEITEQLENANQYYQNALSVLDDTNSLVYKDILTSHSLLCYKKDRQQENTLSQLYHLLNQSNSEAEYLSRCLTIGEVYYYEKQFDSAWYYLNNVYCNSQSAASRKQAAEWLIEICKVKGREADIMEYANFLVPFANQEENNSAIKSRLTELYNAFRQGVSDRQHLRIVRKNAQWTAVAIGVLLFILLAIAWLYHKNKKKLQYIESQKPEEPAKAQDRLLAFMEEPICQAIVQSVQGQNIKRLATPKAFPELVLSDAQLQQLSMAANRHFSQIDILLEQHELKAKPTLVNLCHLYLLGMDEKQAAILLNRDYSSVKRYEKTLKTAFNTQQNMVVFMRNLVLNS